MGKILTIESEGTKIHLTETDDKKVMLLIIDDQSWAINEYLANEIVEHLTYQFDIV